MSKISKFFLITILLLSTECRQFRYLKEDKPKKENINL